MDAKWKPAQLRHSIGEASLRFLILPLCYTLLRNFMETSTCAVAGWTAVKVVHCGKGPFLKLTLVTLVIAKSHCSDKVELTYSRNQYSGKASEWRSNSQSCLSRKVLMVFARMTLRSLPDERYGYRITYTGALLNTRKLIYVPSTDKGLDRNFANSFPVESCRI